MKKLFFTVGPSQLYPTVPTHISNALGNNIYSLSHRSETFVAINKQTQTVLRQLLSIPQTHHIFYTSCALEAMERVIQNTVEKKSFHFVNGSFSREFYQIAVDLHKNAIRFDAPNGEGFDLDSVVIPDDVELICLVQNETSTGVSIPMEMIYSLKKRYPKRLIAIDIVSSVPYVDIDFSLIDIAFFSVQKGFGMPAGLGVLLVNEQALEKAAWLEKRGSVIGSYHNFLKYKEFEEKFQTRETPHVGNIYLLGKVAQAMLDRGIDTIRQEIDAKADMIYTFFDAHQRFNPAVKEPFRSQTTIVIDVEGESEKIVNQMKQRNIVLAKGYGKRKDMHVRIANFPAHSMDDVKQLVTELKQI